MSHAWTDAKYSIKCFPGSLSSTAVRKRYVAQRLLCLEPIEPSTPVLKPRVSATQNENTLSPVKTPLAVSSKLSHGLAAAGSDGVVKDLQPLSLTPGRVAGPIPGMVGAPPPIRTLKSTPSAVDEKAPNSVAVVSKGPGSLSSHVSLSSAEVPGRVTPGAVPPAPMAGLGGMAGFGGMAPPPGLPNIAIPPMTIPAPGLPLGKFKGMDEMLPTVLPLGRKIHWRNLAGKAFGSSVWASLAVKGPEGGSPTAGPTDGKNPEAADGISSHSRPRPTESVSSLRPEFIETLKDLFAPSAKAGGKMGSDSPSSTGLSRNPGSVSSMESSNLNDPSELSANSPRQGHGSHDPASARSVTSATSGSVALPPICLLDSKRAQNVAVVLARINLKAFTESLKSLEAKEGVSVDDIERFKSVILTNDEINMLLVYKGTPERLRDIESKLVAFAVIPRLHQRVRMLFYSLQLPTMKDDCVIGMKILSEAADVLLTSQRIRQILAAVLALGSYVNHGSAQNPCVMRGVSVDSLVKLLDLRSAAGTQAGQVSSASGLDPNPLTGMHVVCAMFLKQNVLNTLPDTAFQSGHPSKEMTDSMQACVDSLASRELKALKAVGGVAFENIEGFFASMKTEQGVVVNELNLVSQSHAGSAPVDPASSGQATHSGSKIYSDHCVEKLNALLSKSRADVAEVDTALTALQGKFAELKKFFGEERLTGEGILGAFRCFMESFVLALQQVSKNHKKYGVLLESL